MTKLPGKLIVVEGLDGSGKSTQIALLRRFLEREGYKVFFTEWNSSSTVKKVTKKGKEEKSLTPTTFSLIHATDLADRYEKQILPLLHAGYLVLCDRYIYTAFARDGVRGCDKTWLKNLYSFAPKPDIVFFFDVPLSIALDRILAGRPSLKFHEAGMDLELSDDIEDSFKLFQGLIYDQYKKLKKEYGFFTIDGTKAPEAQQMLVRDVIQKKIDLKKFKKNKSQSSVR